MKLEAKDVRWTATFSLNPSRCSALICAQQSNRYQQKKQTSRIFGWSMSRRICQQHRGESTDQWAAESVISVKIPPLFDGSTSWFKNEELIDDWLDLVVLEAGKRGPA